MNQIDTSIISTDEVMAWLLGFTSGMQSLDFAAFKHNGVPDETAVELAQRRAAATATAISNDPAAIEQVRMVLAKSRLGLADADDLPAPRLKLSLNGWDTSGE